MTTASAALPAPLSSTDSASLGRARALFWFTLAVFLLATIVGLGWDRRWHTTHAFETFYSPPHLFIYATSLLATGLVGLMVVVPNLRRWFGYSPLILLTGGFVMQGFAGLVFDNIWHSNFGLDETGWSFPHAMLAWTFFITLLGFVACRLALRTYRPMPWYTMLLLGYLVLGFSAAPFLGPLFGNHTPATVAVISRIPVLLNQAAAQHTYRIYLTWNLTRTNVFFLLLSSLWAGAALALVRALDKRAWFFLSIALLWWAVSTLADQSQVLGLDRFLLAQGHPLAVALVNNPANWLPPPIFPAALFFAIAAAIGLPDLLGWTLAGWFFGFITLIIWKAQPFGFLVALLAGPLMALGALAGRRAYRFLEKPGGAAVTAFLLIFGLGVPLLTGLVDLYLRLHTR